MKTFWQKFIHCLVLLTVVGNLTIPSIALAAQCVRTGSVCVEGPETRNINGFPNYQPCWRYEDSYTCTAAAGEKSCGPLESTVGCGQTFIQCMQNGVDGSCISYTKKYTCDKDIKTTQSGGILPNGIKELTPTHIIRSGWDETECKAMTGQFSFCKNVQTQCSQGTAEKVINGVKVSFPCWEESRSYECLGQQQDTCNELAQNPKCSLQKSNCLNSINGECQTGENVYKCMTQEGSSGSSDSCKDADFAKAMTGLEAGREFAQYFDENTLSFFKGDSAECSIKLGGALGGDCCKTKGDHNAWRDAAINTAASYALGQLASSYTFTVLTTGASSTVAAMVGGQAITASMSTFGVGASVSSTGSIALTFNPVFFAAAVIMYVVMEWLACEQEDKKTALRNKAGLCQHVGSYCSSKVLGACLEKKQAYCCYVSKLAKLINVQGREQIGRSMGSAESPDCSGFTAQDLDRVDFSKMDLTEFLDEIKVTLPDPAAQSGNAEGSANQQLNNLINNGANYYGQ